MKAELFNYQCWIELTEPAILCEKMEHFLLQSKFEILGKIDHHFQPFGYTAVWLLAESHLAIHTYPEEAKTYIEITSCVDRKLDAFKQLLSTNFITQAHP